MELKLLQKSNNNIMLITCLLTILLSNLTRAQTLVSNPTINTAGDTEKKITKLKLDSTIIERFDLNNNSKVEKLKDIFIYNNNGYVVSETRFGWNDSLKTWQKMNNYSYEYNLLNKKSKEELTVWNSKTNEVNTSSIGIFFYDSLGNLKSRQYETTSYGFFIKSRYDYDYFNSNKLKSILSYGWNKADSVWTNNTLEENIYDSTMRKYNKISSRWDNQKMSFIAWQKREVTLDVNENPVTEFIYNYENSRWVLNSKNQSSYLSINQCSSLINYRDWDSVTNKWQNAIKTEKTFDPTGNFIEENIYNYNNQQWVSTSNTSWTYNNGYLINNILYPRLSEKLQYYSFVNIPKLMISKEFINNVWVNKEKAEYYYSNSTINSVSELNEFKNILYPNPTTGAINLESNKVIKAFKVYDLFGNIAIEQSSNSISRIDLSEIKDGIYFLYLTSDDDKVSKSKIVKNAAR